MAKINHLKHDEKFNKKKVRLINVLSFLYGFSYAISAYIISYYYKEALGVENVSVFFLASHAIILIILLNLHKIIKKIGKSFALFTFLFIRLLAIIFLFFLGVSKLGAVALIIYVIFGFLSWVGLDIVLESFSKDKMSGRIRGLYLTIMNIGILAGPFISTRMLERFNFKAVFLFLLIFNIIIFIISLSGLKNVNHKFNRNLTTLGVMKKIWKRKNIKRVYYISFVLQFFYAGMIIYTPVYLLDIGMSIAEVGTVLTLMLLPFVFIQYPAGSLADKKLGEKEMMIFGLFVMGIAAFSVYFIASASVAIWAAVLFISRIGAALIEILQDSYFYKRVDGHDVDIIDFFRTTRPVGYCIFAVISSILLFFFPLKIIFLLIAAVVLSALYPAFRLKDNLCEDEICELENKKRQLSGRIG